MDKPIRKICKCKERSAISGLIVDQKTHNILDYVCADCEGLIEAPANMKLIIIQKKGG